MSGVLYDGSCSNTSGYISKYYCASIRFWLSDFLN